MLRLGSFKMTAGVLASAVLIVAAGGGVVASNMGFKINKQFSPIAQIPNAIGNNWTALPYFNPYGKASDLCAQAGFPNILVPLNQTVLSFTDPGTNQTFNYTCAAPVAGAGFTIPTNGVGILVKMKGFCSGAPATACTVCCTSACNSPTTPACPIGAADTCGASGPCTARSFILVGSHNPAQSVSVPKFTATTGEYWFSVPYHTTAVTAADLCAQANLESTVLPNGRALITRRRASDGSAINANCGTANASALNLVLGEAFRIHETNPSGKTFIPAHF